ncbi:MAG TPA: hypothetical protein VMU61_15425 [Candidatus Aquilonibacter sp.]|nr:hypothetical protein [Candidatus Aquilonibacter sp.]
MKRGFIPGLMIVLAGLLTLCGLTAPAGARSKEKPKSGTDLVDSGSFGIFVKGQRVLTETFKVEQENSTSIVNSELKETGSGDPASQKSELQITSSGELIRYEWSETSPARSSLEVLPNNDFLIEKITTSSSAKPAEQPFLMPVTSVILDNNFFVQREVLAWRYLATNCHNENNELRCQKGPVEFGALVPQDHTSVRVRMELVGREAVTLHGAEHQLLRLNLSGDGFSWALWVNEQDHFKLMRVVIPDDNTEVVRD